MEHAIRHLLLTCLFIVAAIHAADFKEISIERLPQWHDYAFIPGGYQSNTYRLQNKGDKPLIIRAHVPWRWPP